mmetsp:Transcript_18231/g.30414  ORF Transcript_18231/g.30414 Transcript_18231/m.30414 type:complete len:95 (-) Transcript_18231:255-539(-)
MSNRISVNRWIAKQNNEEDQQSRDSYIESHPEFHLIIMLFKIAVLKDKPEDICKYAEEEFFAEKNRPVLETILREKLYQDKKHSLRKGKRMSKK